MKKTLLVGILAASVNLFGQTVPAGSLDPTFGTGGKVITSVNSGADGAYTVALQADGKIVVAGYTTSAATGKDFVCIRYNADGTPDADFGTNGIAAFDVQLGSDDVVYTMAMHEGKIILGGYSDDGSKKAAAMMRLNADGSVDETFGISGKVITAFSSTTDDEIKVMKVHAITGNIIVGGTAAQTSTNAQGVVGRFMADGTLDTDFNTTGLKLFSNSALYGAGTHYTIIEDLAVKPNGKISFAGWGEQQGLQWSADYVTGRLNADGTADTSYSSDGDAVLNGSFNGNDKLFSLYLKPDDGLIVGGSSYVSNLAYSFVAFEMSAEGTVVGTGSQMAATFSGIDDSMAYGMALDSDGKLILAGSTGAFNTPNERTFALTRANTNYILDNSFGSAGKITTTFSGSAKSEAYDVAVQPDNKIIAVGYSGNDIALARYYGEEALSTNRAEKVMALQVYPNPATSIINITVTDSQLDNTGYTVIDVNGRVILTGTLKAGTNQVDISSLEKGIYFIKNTVYNNSYKVIVE